MSNYLIIINEFDTNNFLLLIVFVNMVLYFFPTAFKVNFACSGIKAGIVDLIFALNYTRINAGIIDHSSMEGLKFCVRRYCNESGIVFFVTFKLSCC